MPKFNAIFLNNLKKEKKDRLEKIEKDLKEQNSEPQYSVTLGAFCQDKFESNITQYKTSNNDNKDVALNSLLYYYFFLNEKSNENEFKEEKDFMKKFFIEIDINDKQLESISKYVNKEKVITIDMEDIDKNGEAVSESARRQKEIEEKNKEKENKKKEFEEAKKNRILEEEKRAKTRPVEKAKPISEIEKNRNTMVSFGDFNEIHLFENFLYERTNRQDPGTDSDYIKAANEAIKSVKDKSTDDLLKEFNENFGLGEKPTEKENEIKNKVVNQIKNKEKISLLDVQVYNVWARKTYGKPKSIDNVAKGIAEYNALNKKFQDRLFSRWFEFTGLFPEATKEKKALEKMRNHLENTLNVPISKIDKSLNDGKELSIAISDLSKSEDYPIFKNDRMERLFPPKQFNLESNALDIPNDDVEDIVENKNMNINLNNDIQYKKEKEIEQVIE